MNKFKFAGIIICLFFFMGINAQNYQWKSLAIGGGGYITGMIFHPTEENLAYVRTDVGGIYRLDNWGEVGVRPEWKQLFNWSADEIGMWGCDGLAINPQNANEVYAAVGIDEYNDQLKHGVFKSTDRGETWTKILTTKFRANPGANKTYGECIAVKPEGEGKIVFVGTRYDGLQKSTNGGITWNVIASVDKSEGIGPRSIAIDPKNPNTMYVATPVAIYMSTNGGDNFSPILGNDGNEKRNVRIASDGTLYATTANGLYIYKNGTGTLKPIVPPITGNNPIKAVNWGALDVDPFNPQHLIISEREGDFKNTIMRSEDAGDTWKDMTGQDMTNQTIRVNTQNVPWYSASYFGAAIACVKFNPFRQNEFWFTDWYMAWVCKNANADPLVDPTDVYHYESIPWGFEELVLFDMVTTPGDVILYSGASDMNGFTHTSLTEYPAIHYTGNQETTGIDYSELNPDHAVRVSSNGWSKTNFKFETTTNGGVTWTAVTNRFSTTGKIVCVPDNVNHFIFAPTSTPNNEKEALQVTTDGGRTFTQCIGVPAVVFNSQFFDNWDRPVAADKINPNVFYTISKGNGGSYNTFLSYLYVSTDGGFTFNPIGGSLPNRSGAPGYHFAPSPYNEGELWLSTGANGLYHITGSGATCTKKGPFSSSKTVAIGPPISGNIPIVYTYAKHPTTGWGAYRSLDNGATWEQINANGPSMGNQPRLLAADRRHPGRVFVGTGGNGVYYIDTHIDQSVTANPIISPTLKEIGSDTEIWLYAEDAQIYYTLDGTTPTTSSDLYTVPFTINQSAVLKAIAVKNGIISDLSEKEYTVTSGGLSSILSSPALRNDDNIKIFPNPISSSEMLNIEVDNNCADRFDIINVVGQRIYSGAIGSQNIQVGLRGCTKGVYIVNFLKKGKFVRSEKLMVIK